MGRPIPFGKYYLLERINVGGMAEVFKAKATGVEGFEKLVAIKKILPNISEDEEFVEMFIDEAKIAVQLSHANIAQIFDLGMIEDSYFIAMEYVHGRDLRAVFERLRKRGISMPIGSVCHAISQVCEGLEYAHRKKDSSGRELHIVHRDVSPQNILISFDGDVKLIDFGIAKAAGKVSRTQAGILKGKFGYMSPEQVRGLPVDNRSDIFSLGVILYEMLTGERLFTGESDFSTLEKIRNVDIKPPSRVNANIPEMLEKIVMKVLTKDADDRYQHATELSEDLHRFLIQNQMLYTRRELGAYMKSLYADELARETQRLEEMARQEAAGVNLPPPLPGTPARVEWTDSKREQEPAGAGTGAFSSPTSKGSKSGGEFELALDRAIGEIAESPDGNEVLSGPSQGGTSSSGSYRSQSGARLEHITQAAIRSTEEKAFFARHGWMFLVAGAVAAVVIAIAAAIQFSGGEAVPAAPGTMFVTALP
ncbi:MAG: serine/threonine-protein kinase, partial [Myxococcota bacterium]